MKYKKLLDKYNISKVELIGLLITIMEDLTLVELEYLLANIEMELEYREEQDLLDEDDDEI